MTKEQFMKKNEMTAMDYRNLKRYEQVRAHGVMNMDEYLAMMNTHNLNGGSKLASWIQSGTNYEEFRQTLDEEKGGKKNEMA